MVILIIFFTKNSMQIRDLKYIKNSSKFKYKKNIDMFWLKSLETYLKFDIFNEVDFIF
jgi:hypothetical protein